MKKALVLSFLLRLLNSVKVFLYHVSSILEWTLCPRKGFLLLPNLVQFFFFLIDYKHQHHHEGKKNVSANILAQLIVGVWKTIEVQLQKIVKKNMVVQLKTRHVFRVLIVFKETLRVFKKLLLMSLWFERIGYILLKFLWRLSNCPFVVEILNMFLFQSSVVFVDILP